MKTTFYAGGALLVLLLVSGIGVAQDEPKDKKEDHKSEAKADTYDLSIKFVKGQKSRYKNTTVTTTSSEVMGQKTKRKNTNGGTTVFECTGVDDDGNASIVMSYDRLIMKVTTNDNTELDYDSARDTLEQINKNYQPAAIMKDYKFTSTVSPKGEVSKVDGWDKYMKGVKEVADPETADLFASMLTDQAVRDAVEWLYYSAHEEAVKPGDSWKVERKKKVAMVGELTYTRTYTFKDVADKLGRHCAHLTLKGDIKGKEGASFQYKDVDWKGDVWVDLKTREVVCEDSVMKFTMTMKFGNTEIKSPSKTHTKMELVTEEKKDADTPKDEKKDAGK
jgi:hypothetical protein